VVQLSREVACSDQRLRILVVEDEPIQARVLARLLQAAGYEVHTAGNIDEGMHQLQASQFDLLISDLNLPDGNGRDLMRWARDALALPGIALSGYCSEEDIRQSRAAGFSEHIAKPCDLQSLLIAISRFVHC